MTPEEIDAMEAGPELDLQVARHVMGMRAAWTVAEILTVADDGYPYVARGVEDGKNCMLLYTRSDGVNRWSPSTNIAEAWQVIEALQNKKSYRGCELTNFSQNFMEYHWHMEFNYFVSIADDPLDDPEIGYESADANTAPLAICRAALKVALARIPA